MPHIGTFSLYCYFALFMVFLFFITRHSKPFTLRSSLIWTGIWVGVALFFNILLWIYLLITYDAVIANQKALDFLTGFLIEKSLSVDNLFVFYMIFNHFKFPPATQQRIFAYGIYGALVFRLLVILGGSYLIDKYEWILYVLGVALILTGIKMYFPEKQKVDISDSRLYKTLTKYLRISHKHEDRKFFVKQNKRWFATPVFLALIIVEISDIMFAFDSIPAIFAITRDPFIVWASNIFALLGLRALYFSLAAMAKKFELLKYAVATILIYVGMKMLIKQYIHISTLFSLSVIIGVLTLFVLLSMRKKVIE